MCYFDTNGNVGIGTSSPARQVHLHDADGDNNLHITNVTTGATATDGFSIVSQSSTNDVILNQRENSNLIIHTNATERMRIDNSGNVGIGTTSPTGNLHVQGTGPTIRVTSEAGGYSNLQLGDTADTVRGGITYYSTDNSLQLRGYNNTTPIVTGKHE